MDLGIRGDHGDSVFREVRHIEIALVVEADAIGGAHLFEIHGPHVVAGDFAIRIKRDLMDGTIAKVAHIQIAGLVKRDTVGTVLALGVARDECGDQVRIGQSVGYLDVVSIQWESIDTAQQASAGVLDIGHHALGDVDVAAMNTHSVRMLHTLRHNGGCDHLVALDAKAQHAAFEFALGFIRPALIVTDIEVAIRPEFNAHRTGQAGFRQYRDVHPFVDLVVLADFDQATGLALVFEIRASHHQIAVRRNGHAIRCGASIWQRSEQPRRLHGWLSWGRCAA